jgi:hypothetical protein
MVKDIFTLASEYQDKLQPLMKTAAKEKMNRGKMSKTLERAKTEYGQLKKNLDMLEADDTKLKEKLESTRTGAAAARKKMMKIHKAMQCMDLANANDAIFYADDDEDVGYVINGKEFHLEVDNDGEVKLVPMSQHRKTKKSKKDENCVDEGCADDAHAHVSKLDKKSKIQAEDEAEADDEEDTDSGDGEFDDLYASLLE